MSSARSAHVRREDKHWIVLTDQGALLGRVERVPAAVANLGKSKTKPTFNANGLLWQASPEGADLNPDDQRAVLRAATRKKRTKDTAGAYLLAAYEAAGFVLPDPPPRIRNRTPSRSSGERRSATL